MILGPTPSLQTSFERSSLCGTISHPQLKQEALGRTPIRRES
jgi:hypothetical protein